MSKPRDGYYYAPFDDAVSLVLVVVAIAALLGGIAVLSWKAGDETRAQRRQERDAWYAECEAVKPRFECQALRAVMCRDDFTCWR